MVFEKLSEELLMKELFSSGLNNIEDGSDVKICPSCADDSGKYFVDKFHRVEFCSVCETFVQIEEALPNKYTRTFTCWDMRAATDIVKESLTHVDEKCMQMELDAFGISQDLIQKYNVGFYPAGYWCDKETDWKFGKLILPMETFDGDLINLVGKSVGKKEKVLKNDTQILYPKNSSLFNRLGWFNSVVNVFTDPVDVLIAIQNGYTNSVLLSSKIIFPEDAVVQEKINVIMNGGDSLFPLINLVYYSKKHGVELNVFDIRKEKQNITESLLGDL